MSNFRILILAFLVVVLAVLGMIYVNISSRMDVIQQQQQKRQDKNAEITHVVKR